MERESNALTIYLYDLDGGGEDRPQVTPGRALVARGQEVQWENLTGDEITLHLPPQIFSTPTPVLSVPAGSPSSVLTIAPRAKPGGYSYVGVRKKPQGGFEFLVGGSNPVFIIR